MWAHIGLYATNIGYDVNTAREKSIDPHAPMGFNLTYVCDLYQNSDANKLEFNDALDANMGKQKF